MGIYDRDYYRESPRGGFGEFNALSVTTWLIIINVVVYFLDGLLGRLSGDGMMRFSRGPLTQLGYFSVDSAVKHLEVWRFITFQFLHASPTHLLYNMIGLFMFGPIAEAQLGVRRYLGYYLSCGIAGAIAYMMLWGVHLIAGDASDPMVGASAGIFGVLFAAAKITPGMTINLIFPPFPIEVRFLAWAYFGIAVLTIVEMGMNAGGEAAHIGGALWGFVLIRNQHWLSFLAPARSLARGKRKAISKDWSRDMNR